MAGPLPARHDRGRVRAPEGAGDRGLTLDEAARDTKLRVELLARSKTRTSTRWAATSTSAATLRTYAQYLGLNPDKVVAAYARHADEPEPPPPPRKMGRVERRWPPRGSATTSGSC